MHRLFRLLALAAFVTIDVSGRAAAPVGPVAAFGFNEGAGTTTADESGNAHIGSLVRTAWTKSGRYGNGLSFDGLSRVSVADKASLDLKTGLTLEAWVYPTSSTGWRPVVIKERFAGMVYALYASNNASRPAVHLRVGGADWSVARSSSLPTSTWTHLAATFDGTMLSLYVNGKPEASRAVRGSIETSDRGLQIGGSTTMSGRYFRGSLDEVHLYERALAASEILANSSPRVAFPPGGGSTPATLTVLSPSGASHVWTADQPATITWSSSVGGTWTSSLSGAVRIQLSRDGGETYPILIADGTPSDGTETILVPAGWETSRARISVTSMSDPSVFDTSDADFTIEAAATPATLTVLSPNGASHAWTADQPATITWSSSLSGPGGVRIQLSRDGGETYPILIAEGTPSDGTETILVPAGWETSRARISVTSMSDPSVFDTSDADFTIEAAATPATLTVLSPNGASHAWTADQPATITWSSSLSGPGGVRIQLSRDGGETYPILIADGTPSDGTETILVPAGWETSRARISVTSMSDPSVFDTSDADFTIEAAATPATLTVLSPNGASHAWTADQPATITWSSSLSGPGAVRIQLSRDGGETYPILIADGTPSDGTETILVPAGWETSRARISVTSMSDPSVFDTSDADFTIEAAGIAEVTFEPSSAVFPNPERGFFVGADLDTPYYPLIREFGYTLTRPYIRLDAYRDRPLPQSFLDALTPSFERARQAGVKIIPRFSYNFGPFPDSEPDASLLQIWRHLQQLAPVLTANVDVISSVEAGFIGAWGEWHTSTNGLDVPIAKASVLSALMAAVPSSRMIALRYPTDMQLLNGPPIEAAEAFSGTNRARVGSHQDCFLASADDWGTWGRTGNAYEYDKAYVALNGLFAVVGGETCNVNPPRTDCPTAVAEMEYMHWSYLNVGYEPGVMQRFKDGGCFSDIERRLGYRYELSSANYSATARPGGNFNLSLHLRNQGFAAMFNARPVFSVLYSSTEKYLCQFDADPRRWAAGAAATISQTCTLPASMTPGTYSLALWLPDEAASLRNNPLYAVQFANLGVWDAGQGFNVIAANVVIR